MQEPWDAWGDKILEYSSVICQVGNSVETGKEESRGSLSSSSFSRIYRFQVKFINSKI